MYLMFPKKNLKKPVEELELFMNLKYKPPSEIACEAINTLLDENHYTEVRKELIMILQL